MGLLPHPRVCGRCGRDDTPLAILSEDHGWCCVACTPVDPDEMLPPGTREYLRLLRTLPVEEAPDPDCSEASRTVTLLLRSRLLREFGGLKSYDVLHRLLG
jgi:recombinational DNA repair protein (RecF pathway)